jgi:hypothetical protein
VREDDTGSGFSGIVNALEDRVGRTISAAALPPTLHNSSVVSVYLKARDWVGLGSLNDAEDEELKADGLSPPDVAAVGFPAWDEAPGAPPSIDPNRDSHARASIREGVRVGDGAWTRYCPADEWLTEGG